MAQYLNKVEQHLIIKDNAQLKAIDKLQLLIDGLQSRNWLRSIMRSQRGVFLWGDVGVGKTWLMDLFYAELRGVKKCRYHYHEFMEMIHQRMAENKDKVNPLNIIAKEISLECKLLCLDELHVPEIADAMLLHGVLDGLFKQRIILVTTSNYAPDRLYENGFHRDIFLPAIALLKHHSEVIEINTDTDYRIQNIIKRTPLKQLTQCINKTALDAIFSKLKTGPDWDTHQIMINQRPLPVIKVADGVIWLNFSEICGDPRATRDYIELSQTFGAVIISNIDPKLAADQSRARRFLHFVDELYDHQIKLVISAMGNLLHEYKNKTLRFQFARTVSRLYEMQSLMVSQGYIEVSEDQDLC